MREGLVASQNTKTAIRKYAQQRDISASFVYVSDGSRRRHKRNAFALVKGRVTGMRLTQRTPSHLLPLMLLVLLLLLYAPVVS